VIVVADVAGDGGWGMEDGEMGVDERGGPNPNFHKFVTTEDGGSKSLTRSQRVNRSKL
jgi:hypothetical protein